MAFIFDPKIFNYVIMSMYALNVGRWTAQWAYSGVGLADASYWLCALGITATVTWGYVR